MDDTTRDLAKSAFMEPGESNLDDEYVRRFIESGGQFVGTGSWPDVYGTLTDAVAAIDAPHGIAELLIHVTAGDDLKIGDVEQIVRLIRESTKVNENSIYWGLHYEPSLENEITVTLFAKTK